MESNLCFRANPANFIHKKAHTHEFRAQIPAQDAQTIQGWLNLRDCVVGYSPGYIREALLKQIPDHI
jgi:hypothetical protein